MNMASLIGEVKQEDRSVYLVASKTKLRHVRSQIAHYDMEIKRLDEQKEKLVIKLTKAMDKYSKIEAGDWSVLDQVKVGKEKSDDGQ
jgi:hypothetical protein